MCVNTDPWPVGLIHDDGEPDCLATVEKREPNSEYVKLTRFFMQEHPEWTEKQCRSMAEVSLDLGQMHGVEVEGYKQYVLDNYAVS